MPTRCSFQLYSARKHGPLEATLAMLAGCGYREVEGFADAYGEPERLRKLLDAHGLTMPSGHFSIDMMERNRSEVLDIAATLGMNKLVMPYLPASERPADSRGWREFGERLNGIAASYRGEGYGVAWHNHDFEFTSLADGALPHDLLFAAAPLLDWEIDVAWVVRAGMEPLAWVKRYAAAITLAHIKDIAPEGENADEDGWTDVGAGVVDWGACMEALRDTKCMHRVVEHDNPRDVERFARRSIAALRDW